MKSLTALILGMMVLVHYVATANQISKNRVTLDKVIVLFDRVDNDFSSRFYIQHQGTVLELAMDASCSQVKVAKDGRVICQGTYGEVIVGQRMNILAQDHYWQSFRVRWSPSVFLDHRMMNGQIKPTVRVHGFGLTGR